MSGGRPCCTPSGPAGPVRPEADAATPGTAGGSAQDPGTSAAAHRPALVALPGGAFRMGTDSDVGYAEDGEGPARPVSVSPFSIAPHAVTNAEFATFVRATRHVTDAEQFGTSFVFWLQVDEAVRQRVRHLPTGLPWWLPIEGACWQRPEGPGSSILDRPDHPVVHVSWNDAAAYCRWSGTRLPSEAEWEYAARGGLEECLYPWGDELGDEGRGRCNIWQGRFPDAPTLPWRPGPVPVHRFAPNGFGLFNMVGNVWEWCDDWFSPTYHADTAAVDPRQTRLTGRRSMRGGSFLCHASYCNRYRVAGRHANAPASASSNTGFRVAR